MIALVAALGVLAMAMLLLVRLFAGPTLHDRAMAANLIGVLAALACAALGVAARNAAWVDVALALMFAALLSAAAAMKFFRTRSFQPPLARRGDAG